MKTTSVLFAGLLILSCSKQVGPGNPQGIMSKDSLVKLYPILASEAHSFEDVFAVNKVIQLETRGDNVLGYCNFQVSSDGKILVVDFYPGRRAYLFDSTGALLLTVGGEGKGPGEYVAPNGPAFDRRGNMYVQDGARDIVNKYDSRGKFLTQLQLKRSFHKLTVDRGGNLFFFRSTSSNRKDATVYKYDSLGNLLITFAILPESYEPSGGAIGGGIAFDSVGRIYQITPYEYRVQVFSSDGELLNSFGEPPSYFRPISKPTGNPQSSPQQLSSFHSSWTHIWEFQIYRNSMLVIITGDDERGKFVRRADLMDLAGSPIQTGLAFFLQASVFSQGQYFYVLLQNEPDKEGFVLNPKVIRYKLKEGA